MSFIRTRPFQSNPDGTTTAIDPFDFKYRDLTLNDGTVKAGPFKLVAVNSSEGVGELAFGAADGTFVPWHSVRFGNYRP